MSTIINKENKYFEYQSHRVYPTNWNGDGWVAVPPEFEAIVMNNSPYLDLELDGDLITNVIALEKPPEPPAQPTEEEKLRADIDFIACLQGVVL